MKTHVLILLAATAVLLPAGARLEAQRQTRKVFITAVDQRGAPVLDLTEADFRIREGGTARKITSARLSTEPLRVALLIDSSDAIERSLNEVRAGLVAFLTALPAEHEVVFLSIGRQMRIRVPPTLDRERLLAAARQFAGDGGGTVLLDAVREANDRFMRPAENRWPIMVVVATDGPERSGTMHDDEYLRFVQNLVLRQTTVHTMLLQWGGGPSLAAEVGMNLARNTGGEYRFDAHREPA